MNRRAFICFLNLCFAAHSTVFSADPVIIGPGTHPPIYENNNVDYHIVTGTEIVSPSETAGSLVVGSNAIEFRGGGHLNIDGGYYKGGDVRYIVSNKVVIVAGGDALVLLDSSVEVHDGTFVGGDAISATGSNLVHGGEGIFLVRSEMTIHGGLFKGGTATYPGFGGMTVQKAPAIVVTDGSTLIVNGGDIAGDMQIQRSEFLGGLVVMNGGRVEGNIKVFPLAILSVFGTNLQYVGDTLSGNYIGGTPFSHTVFNFGGSVVLNMIPEPSTSAMVIAAFVSWSTIIRRRRHSCLNG